MICLHEIVAEKNVRVLVTSQPEPVFLDRFDLAIDLKDHIKRMKDEMRKVLGGRIYRHCRLSSIPHSTKEEKTHGSFWYAQCQVDSLRECQSVRSVQDIVQNLAANLPRTYSSKPKA